MPYLSDITHSNKNTEGKVNFFADYFRFANIRLGEFKEIPFENHLSLIEKSIYQIETNLKKSTPYLKKYFRNNLLDPDDFISRFSTATRCCNYISTYLEQADSGKKKWIIDNPDFVISLKALKVELEESMLDEAISSLISYLRCKHKLRTHIKAIKYCANILVTEFRYRKYSKKDVRNTISKIMSSDINEFPFPKSITDQKSKENYDEIKRKFMGNRNFNTQFEGIKNLFEKESHETYFIFKIYNLSAKGLSGFLLKYDNVTFLSPSHISFKAIRKVTKNKFFAEDYFKNKNKFILAYTKIKYESIDVGAEKAKETIRNELKYLNYKLDSNGVIDENYYLITNDFINIGSSRKFKPETRTIKQRDFDKLSKNIFESLKEIPNNTKGPLVFFEHKFRDAYNGKDIPNLWHFLENIIPTNEKDEKQVKTVVSNILLLDHRYRSKRTLSFDFSNCVSGMSISGNKIGLTHDEQYFIERNYYKINPLNYKKKITRPFVKDLLNLYQLHASKKNLIFVKDYYCSILTEAYELRNMKTHKGVSNTKVEIKLKHIFPMIVMRFRMILLNEFNDSCGIDFDDMIINLNRKASELLE